MKKINRKKGEHEKIIRAINSEQMERNWNRMQSRKYQFEKGDENRGEKIYELKKRIANMEQWFAEEIKRKENEINRLKKEKNIFFNSAIKQAGMVRELNATVERLRQRILELEKILERKKNNSKNKKE